MDTNVSMEDVHIKALLVDDEPRGLSSLENLLVKHCGYVEVIGKAKTVSEALAVINGHDPNLVFLDVSLPPDDGFDLLKNFETINFELIFVTAHEEYALKAFKYSAIDYLLKPVKSESLIKSVKKAEERIRKKINNRNYQILYGVKSEYNHQTQTFALPTSTGLVFVKIDEIIYCEACENNTWFYLTGKEKILVSRGISDYEALLEPYDFHRIHHSHIINLARTKKYIRGRGGYVVMDDGTSINVSVRKKMDFLEKLLK